METRHVVSGGATHTPLQSHAYAVRTVLLFIHRIPPPVGYPPPPVPSIRPRRRLCDKTSKGITCSESFFAKERRAKEIRKIRVKPQRDFSPKTTDHTNAG